MSPLSTLNYVLPLIQLSQLALAQDSPQCSPIASQLAYNASSTVPMPAFRPVILGTEPRARVQIEEQSDAEWNLTYYVQPLPGWRNYGDNPNMTQSTLWLDWGSSNAERLGGGLGFCHNFVSLQFNGNTTWSYDALKKSVNDAGDCRTLVSDACLESLQAHYYNEALRQRSRWLKNGGVNECGIENQTVPWECAASGMVLPQSRMNPYFNDSLWSRFGYIENRQSLNTTNTVVCNGQNMSHATGTRLADADYDLAMNFPVMDIMTFFSRWNVSSYDYNFARQVHIKCFLPNQMEEGSRAKESVESVLSRFNSTGGNDTIESPDEGGAQTMGRGLATWVLVAWTLGVGCAFAM